MVGLDFSAVAHDLLRGNAAGLTLAQRLEQRCPALARQIETDGDRSAMLQLWGQSLNVDENTGTVIVPLPFIEALGAMARVPMNHPIVHAGVNHTYGYLFSIIDTPYGHKRDRWVKGQVAKTLGIPEDAIAPQSRNGTFLTNVTYLLGRVAFRGRRREQQALRSLRPLVAAELREYAYARLRGYRIVETIEGSANAVQIITELVEAPCTQNSMRLLVYWWSDSAGSAKLITAFPISRDASDELRAPERFSTKVDIVIRYNGYIEPLNGSPGRTYRGTRALHAHSARLQRLA